MPFAVAKFTLTAWPLGALSVTVNVAVPVASFTVMSLIASEGVGSLSVIVAVPIALALVVVPAVRVAVSVKVSAASSSASSVIGARTSRAARDNPPLPPR